MALSISSWATDKYLAVLVMFLMPERLLRLDRGMIEPVVDANGKGLPHRLCAYLKGTETSNGFPLESNALEMPPNPHLSQKCAADMITT